jgi:DNA adenine methylase
VSEPNALRAPFPYFGGKSRIAPTLWAAFGHDVPNYIEPFCGSLATLLARPNGPGKIETANDAACAIANFWRAMAADPEAVARACDRPVNECDMHAMHIWLVSRFEEIGERLRTDIRFFDAEAAGLWVHGQCAWIGGGWCGGVKRGQTRPNLTSQGVHAYAYSPGRRPGLVDQGVHLPSIGNDRGINGVAAPPTIEWFQSIAARIRRVRVVCGDWKRVLTPSVLGKGKNVGGRRPVAILLDPPYSHEIRDPYLYSEDEAKVSALVRAWALEHGDDRDLRIALCGYQGEHEMPGWTCHAWTGARGYAATDNANRELERIWFSPHCLPLEAPQRSLFAGGMP